MKSLLIACSPRKGNTDLLAARARKLLAETDTVYLRELCYAPCCGCDACVADGVCVHRDDAAELYRKLYGFNDVILFAPAYFYNFDAHTKAFLDRAQYAWHAKNSPSSLRVHLVACGGQRYADNFDGMKKTFRIWGKTLGATVADGLCFYGADAIGDLSCEEADAKLSDYFAKYCMV